MKIKNVFTYFYVLFCFLSFDDNNWKSKNKLKIKNFNEPDILMWSKSLFFTQKPEWKIQGVS